MIETFVKKPAMTIMLIMVFVVMGMVSYFNLIQERTPKVEFPMVTVDLVYAGASPIEIESQLVKKVEDAVSEISDIKSIKSFVFENFGRVLIEFKLSADVNIKSIEIKDKVEAIRNEFPDNANAPIISKFDPLMTSVLDLVLQSSKHSDVELFEYADKTLKNKLTVISGVASVDVSGGKERQINVVADNNLLIKNYLTINDIISAIQSENINIPGGSVRSTRSNTGVRFVGEFVDVEQLKNLKISSREGKVFKLSELATVEDGHKKVETITTFNGFPSVLMSILKLSDGSAVDISREIQRKIEVIKTQLPEGMNLQVGYDSTTIIVEDNVGTMNNILIGIILTVLILMIFLGDIRTAFISVLVIPASIISSIFLMDMFGFTLNMMTLLAFGTSLGTLIANALVVIESVYSHLEKGKDPQTAAIDGTKEVLISVIASAGTNIVVFTPIAFMGGIIGQFFLQFGLTVVFATLFSILASISLTPMLCALLLRPKTEKQKKGFNLFEFITGKVDSGLKIFLGYYESTYKFIVTWPLTVTVLFLLLFASSFFAAGKIGFNFFPSSDENFVQIDIVMPEGTPVTKTSKVVKKIESSFKKWPEVESYLSSLGKDGEHNATIKINLTNRLTRKMTDKQLIEKLTPFIATIPEADVTVSAATRGGAGGDITINVYADDFSTLVGISKEVQDVMKQSGFFRSVKSSYRTPKNEIRFEANKDTMIEQGVRNSYLGMTLRNIINGNDDNTYKEKGEEYDINIELHPAQKEEIIDFEKFGIWGKDGLISIGRLGEMKTVKAIPPIRRRDKRRVIVFDGYLAKSSVGHVMGVLTEKLKSVKFPMGSSYAYAGKTEMMKESSREIGKAFLLAIILTVMLLVAVLNSFLLPISIGTTIITSYFGSLLFLFFTDISINIAGMMAFVMLVGLTVNNAIIIVDYAIQKIAEGKSPIEGFWLGVQEKLKTVVMTTLAIIAGTFPQLLDVDVMKSSMGAVIIGGMLGSVLFTYTIVPATFILIYKIKDKKLMKFNLMKIKCKIKKCH
ncbi:MAG: efflux RND transporter permease subunit [Bacteriovoracaceae bacterium]|nr:efflux RND transporter permease subunit [Bacteriovoracaceae bacterium]